MKTIHGTIFVRKDLREEYADVPFDEVRTEMIGIIHAGIGVTDDIFIFMDDDGATKVIKNRYGKAQNS